MLEYIVFCIMCFLAGVGITTIVTGAVIFIRDIVYERKYK